MEEKAQNLRIRKRGRKRYYVGIINEVLIIEARHTKAE